MALKRALIYVFGIVQGVGFRPFVHKLVKEYSIKGYVKNFENGVTIDAEGECDSLLKFILDIEKKAPPLALIERVEVNYKDIKLYKDFEILESSKKNEGFSLISPDISICDDCYREMMDKQNKRYKYPFINCTNCGPRFTIIKDIPYDRNKTSMAKFTMCNDCKEEYENIENRRYHAQPNCCSECGPEIILYDKYKNKIDGDIFKNIGEKILEGRIIAIKGIGGFHLGCNALDLDAVLRLRGVKYRESKPFALMAKDIDIIKKYAYIDKGQINILKSVKRPIVLLQKNKEADLPEEIAPGINTLGFMLPYTPLHHLLFFENDIDLLVMTSANLSDRPIIYNNEEAFSELSSIADYFVINNRDIVTPCDDSVVKVIDDCEYFIRRSRGYVPFPIKLNYNLKSILACGAEQKASFSLSKNNYVFLSQHIGDLKNYETYRSYITQIENFKKLFNIKPEIVACDCHPEYMSTHFAQDMLDIKKVFVQHHHAHMASCMADNNITDDVIGIIYDGTGYGIDNSIWGGEILTGNLFSFNRRGSFLNTKMPGGDLAIKNIEIMAISYLYKTYGENLDKYINYIDKIKNKNISFETIRKMLKNNINTHKTSSAGRLFDGVSSILNLCNLSKYEGEAAVILEANTCFDIEDSLDYRIYKDNGIYIYDWRPTIDNIINYLNSNKDIVYIASCFHNTVAKASVEISSNIRYDTGIEKVVLSGGVFQNSFLLLKTIKYLKNSSFKVYKHKRVSTNDEGISLGQLVIANNGGGNYVHCSSS